MTSHEPLADALDAYQLAAHEFAAYPKGKGEQYVKLALVEEVGELCGVLAKAIRKGVTPSREKIVEELGDVLWNVAEEATLQGEKLGECIRLGLHEEAHSTFPRSILEWPSRIRVIAVLNAIMEMGTSTSEVVSVNLHKLRKRKEGGTLDALVRAAIEVKECSVVGCALELNHGGHHTTTPKPHRACATCGGLINTGPPYQWAEGKQGWCICG